MWLCVGVAAALEVLDDVMEAVAACECVPEFPWLPVAVAVPLGDAACDSVPLAVDDGVSERD